MKAKKNWFLFIVIAVCGVLVGLGISARFKLEQHGEAMNPTPAGSVTTNAEVPTMTRLNQDFVQISAKVTPAVVSISSSKAAKPKAPADPRTDEEDFFDFFSPHSPGDSMPKQGLGSGVIVEAQKGYILTNNHVIADADEIKVALTDRRIVRAKVIGTDPQTDLAVIQVDNIQGFQAAQLGDSNQLQVGEWVLAIGNPFGLNSTVTAGIISAKGRADVGVADFEDFIQTDAAINPGNSGGALINIKGEVIGINTAIATRSSGYMGIGFAIPSNMAQKVMDALIKKGKVTRSQLGVYIRQMDDALAKSLELKQATSGIVVTDVIKDSPAAKAGLRRYDVILKLNGQSVNDVNQFRNTIALTPPGSTIAIDVVRDGAKQVSVQATLREIETQAANPLANPQPDERNAPASRLGFEVRTLTPEMARQMDVPVSVQGVVVTQITRSSRAYERGLRRGDIITELNRKPVQAAEEFNRRATSLKSGDVALLSVTRGEAGFILAFEVE